MKLQLTVIDREDGPDMLAALVDGINEKLADRGCIGDLDAMEASFDVSLHEAVAALGGSVVAVTDTDVVVDLAQAPAEVLELALR